MCMCVYVCVCVCRLIFKTSNVDAMHKKLVEFDEQLPEGHEVGARTPTDHTEDTDHIP